MSENSMMAGYAIKMSEVDEERTNYLYDNFDSTSLNHWQWMYDASGHECLVHLVDAESTFYDNMSVNVSLNDMQYMFDSAVEFSDTSPQFEFTNDAEIIYFAIVWYNGAEMDSIFKEEKDE